MDKSFKLIKLKNPSSFCKTCALNFFCKNDIEEVTIRGKYDFYNQYEFIPVNKLKRRRF